MIFLVCLGGIYTLNILTLLIWLLIYVDVEHSNQENLLRSIIVFIVFGAFIDTLSAICFDELQVLSFCSGNVIGYLMIFGVLESWHLLLLPFDIDTTRCCNWKVLPKTD